MIGLRGNISRKLPSELLQRTTCQQCFHHYRPHARGPSGLSTGQQRSFARSRASPAKQTHNTANTIPHIPISHAKTSSTRSKPRRNAILISLASLAILFGLSVKFTDAGKYSFDTLTRSFRVVNTTYVNIRDYQRTMTSGETASAEDYEEMLKACHKRCAVRTLRAMEKNGSIFIKLGQHLSSLNYLLPSEWCDTFIPLQDKCPVTSFSEVKRLVEGDTGMPFEEVFSEFEERPLGAASLAQVHRAIDRASGEKVAVKVQHPTLDHFAPVDIALTSWTFRMLKRAFPDYDLTWLSDEMEVSLPQELDFALEGQNAERARTYFSTNFPSIPLIIPKVMWARRRLLVMEYISGARPDDLEFLDSHRISRDEVSATLARIFNTMIFAPGAPLHCDPHGGNLAVLHEPKQRSPHNFKIILYDHGLYRTIPLDLQRSYAKLWLAVLDTDEPRMRKYAYEVAEITDEQFPLFASAITGRDYSAVTQNISKTPRTKAEYESITNALYGRAAGASAPSMGSAAGGAGANSAGGGGKTSKLSPSTTEIEAGSGMLQQLVHLLGQVPRIILLILKTNDLTRSLDTNLHTTQGPMRSFLILARYAARTVYDEEVEALFPSTKNSSNSDVYWHWSLSLPPRNAFKFLRAWTAYVRMELRLGMYEWFLWVRGMIGMDNSIRLA